MVLSSSLLWIFPSYLLIFLFALGENYNSEAKCSESFKCGSLDEIRYPFYKSNESATCGLCMVDCDTRSSPTIKLFPQGHEYDSIGVQSVSTTNDIIRLRWFDKRNCLNFVDLSRLNTSSISFTQLSPHIIPLFKCYPTDMKLGNPFPDYRVLDECESDHHFLIYFKNPNVPSTLILPPQGCSIIWLPLAPPRPNPTNDLYVFLADEFDIKWDIKWDVHHKGKKNLVLILGTVLGGVLSIICCVVAFFIWRRRKRANASYIHSRITYSDPSSRTDLESGSLHLGVPVFSYVELEEATDNFDSSNELGDGGFGIVYYGKLRDGREVAVKRLFEHNYKRVEQFRNEIKILTGLRHPNLVCLYGCTSRRSRELLLVYEYISNGTVADHLHGERENERLLSWPIRMNIAVETASALSYLHAKDIIHRDVKTNNILLDQYFSVKVADFGLSRLFPTDVTHVSTAPQGTPGYVDPDYHECYQLTTKSDVYSFGVVLIELISSFPAVDISRQRQEINLANLAINRIQRGAYDELIDSSLGFESNPEVKRMTISIAELAFQCLQLDKELRPTMDEVFEALEDIKEGKDFKFEKTRIIHENSRVYNSVKTPPTPESEGVVLLKNMKVPTSPNSVTDVWISSGSSTTSGNS